MASEIRYYNANSLQDDIEFVTKFPCFLGHPVQYLKNSKHAKKRIRTISKSKQEL